MANSSSIEWTNATWNPATGCTKISEGCANCYAEETAEHLQRIGQEKYKNGFTYTEHIDALQIPLHWKKPKKIFVNSMSDLFHEMATDGFIDEIFKTMMKANQHTYQILTKRPERMMVFIHNWLLRNDLKNVPQHIWLGVTCESQLRIHRIDILRDIPAWIRFVSFEPLLDMVIPNLRDIQWAIVGGESGHKHRPIQKEWVLSLLKSCRQNNTAFFFKQWGGNKPKSNGRELNGKIYDEFPIQNQMITV
jgi:protein gp37